MLEVHQLEVQIGIEKNRVGISENSVLPLANSVGELYLERYAEATQMKQ
jgi:hypothetical protein